MENTVTIALALALLWYLGQALYQNEVNKYIETHPVTSIEAIAMRNREILLGMKREQVEIITNSKGKLISLQGLPAYQYTTTARTYGVEDRWYVIYDDNDKVIWVSRNVVNAFPESSKSKESGARDPITLWEEEQNKKLIQHLK